MNAKTALLACGLLAAARVQAADSSDLNSLLKQASQDRSMKGGYQYETEFLKALGPILSQAMETCGRKTPNTKEGEPADIVFVIAADGRVKQFLYSKNVPFGECLAAKLKAIKKLPRPPRDGWASALSVGNRNHENLGPPDKPRRVTGDHLAQYDRDIAPYIAKARATYPAAKKRFLAGLPAGYTFSVRMPLRDRDGKREDSFVLVQQIKNGNITGTIQSHLGLITNYKTGQQITFPEGKIDNWLILRPDGTEEGNYVGKFLDHYKSR
jgi:uncharacterized protein YegJ (DUF2314 family)